VLRPFNNAPLTKAISLGYKTLFVKARIKPAHQQVRHFDTYAVLYDAYLNL
jgi:hypothetical protein